MTGKPHVFLQLVTYCMSIGLSFALIGPTVRTAHKHQFPNVVSISKRSPNNGSFEVHHICTGTLLSNKTVLTAAHCLLRRITSEIEIIAGSGDLQKGDKYYPQSWVTFDEWRSRRRNHDCLDDIALITLEGNGVHKPNASGSSTLFVDTVYLVNKTVTTVGWGKTRSNTRTQHLRRASVIVMSNEACSTKGSELIEKIFTVPDNYFCTTANPRVISSRGDDGGPIYNRNRQVVGINTGICPKQEMSHAVDFVLENLFNANLNLLSYKEFIEHFKQ